MSRPRKNVDSLHLAELARQGKGVSEIAEISGLSVSAVYWRLREARDVAAMRERQKPDRRQVEPVHWAETREQAASLNARLTAHGRCKCGLLLPCRDCVGDATAYLSSGITDRGT